MIPKRGVWVWSLAGELWGFPGGAEVRNPPANAEDMGSNPESGRFHWVGNGNPLQYSYQDNSMDRGAWQAVVHGVAWTTLLHTKRRRRRGTKIPCITRHSQKKKKKKRKLRKKKRNRDKIIKRFKNTFYALSRVSLALAIRPIATSQHCPLGGIHLTTLLRGLWLTTPGVILAAQGWEEVTPQDKDRNGGWRSFKHRLQARGRIFLHVLEVGRTLSHILPFAGSPGKGQCGFLFIYLLWALLSVWAAGSEFSTVQRGEILREEGKQLGKLVRFCLINVGWRKKLLASPSLLWASC